MYDVRLQTICPECKSSAIYYDKHRAEIYCQECGLVVVQLNSAVQHNLLDYDFSDFKEVSI